MESASHIYGTRAVLEALQAGEPVDRIYFQKGLQGPLAQKLQNLARKKGVRLSYVPDERLARFRDRNHQGVVATISPITFLDYRILIDQVVAGHKAPLLLHQKQDLRCLTQSNYLQTVYYHHASKHRHH